MEATDTFRWSSGQRRMEWLMLVFWLVLGVTQAGNHLRLEPSQRTWPVFMWLMTAVWLGFTLFRLWLRSGWVGIGPAGIRRR